ncbi:MAG TPA: KEOPS complex kinase/ATPase Bud32 [Nitrososphaera sp.]|nr:KEOPS complex kinase/ATPase Bud32 [Nitrososphaera sp.]
MQPELIKKGAEADIYLVEWGGRKAVSKVRTPKPYRHVDLDSTIRRQRTVHEARFMSASKRGGITSPFVYFVDPEKAEIIMEYVAGDIARDVLTPELCIEIGKYSALLHAANIIHGDLTTSNFIVSGRNHRLVLIDFGLAFYSERIEDAATDIRLIKEAFTSAHVQLGSAFDSFVKGYAGTAGEKKAHRVLENVHEIEQRGRYARVT